MVASAGYGDKHASKLGWIIHLVLSLLLSPRCLLLSGALHNCGWFGMWGRFLVLRGIHRGW